MSERQGWIGVDLDGTLAHYDSWKGEDHIGDPIPLMVGRVKQWLEEGKDVRIFTARIAGLSPQDRVKRVHAIAAWCETAIGQRLHVVCQKDFQMIELWDDRCVQVITNKGVTAVEAAIAEREVKNAKK